MLANHRTRRGDARRLSGVLARARHLAALQRRVRALLPPALARHCHVVGHSDTELRLLVENQALATQLRFRQAELLAAVAAAPERARSAAKLSIVVRPPPPSVPEPVRRATPQVPRAAAAELRTLAGAESDPGLRAALERLARRSRQED